MEKLTAFIQLINEGGSVNWVIGGLYIVTLGIISERLTYFLCTRCRKDHLMEALQNYETTDVFEKNLKKGETDNQIYRIVKLCIDHAEKNSAELSELVDREGSLIKREMERGLGLLSFIGTVAPLVGLLGTITGLMEAFSQIEQRGAAVDISFLSGGIREAMITTATGLITAICAVGAEKGFEHLASVRLQDMALGVSVVTERIKLVLSPVLPQEAVRQ